MPGEREHISLLSAREAGIPIGPMLTDDLKALAEEYQVEFALMSNS